MFRKKLFAVFGALLLTASIQASAKDNIYKLAFHISQSGKAEASPTIYVKDGVPGTIELSGTDGYSLTATAVGTGQGKIKVSLAYKSTSNSSSPILIVKEGQEASFKQGNVEVKLVATRRGS